MQPHCKASLYHINNVFVYNVFVLFSWNFEPK